MEFDLSEEQEVVRELADGLFAARSTPTRVSEVLAGDGFDRSLWAALADAGVLGLCLDSSWGGQGMDAVELALVAIAQGRHVAQVPLVPTIVAATVLSRRARAPLRDQLAARLAEGRAVLTSALATPGVNDGATTCVVASGTRGAGGDACAVRVRGSAPSVPWGRHADYALVPVDHDGERRVAVIDLGSDGVTRTAAETTAHEPQAHLAVDTVVPDGALLDGNVADELRLRTLAANAAVVVGLAEGALRMTAEHVSNRVQFGRPLASFQAVTQRAANAYIDSEAVRVTALSAAWHLAAGLDARRAVALASYWACDGGQRITHACQHLHGGVGADVEYPLHRYQLWSSQIATALGAASAHLAELGRLLAEEGRR